MSVFLCFFFLCPPPSFWTVFSLLVVVLLCFPGCGNLFRGPGRPTVDVGLTEVVWAFSVASSLRSFWAFLTLLQALRPFWLQVSPMLEGVSAPDGPSLGDGVSLSFSAADRGAGTC